MSSKAWASDCRAVGLDPGGEQQQDRAFECGVGQELVAERRPAGLEGHRRAHLVEHLDPGRESGLHRVLGEQALGERVQGADGRTVELLQGEPGTRSDVTSGIGLGRLLQCGPDAVAQLGARLLGEGDGGDTAELDLAARHQGQDAVDQGRGLAGSGAGLDEEGGVEVLGDPLARRLIGRRGKGAGCELAQSSASCSVSVSTSMSSSGWAKLTKASMASSARLCSY